MRFELDLPGLEVSIWMAEQFQQRSQKRPRNGAVVGTVSCKVRCARFYPNYGLYCVTLLCIVSAAMPQAGMQPLALRFSIFLGH